MSSILSPSQMSLLPQGLKRCRILLPYPATVNICHFATWPSSLHITHPENTIFPSSHSIKHSRMATASKVKLSLDACGIFHVPGITQESAAKASEVLQENHDNHHIFMSKSGFHSKLYTSLGNLVFHRISVPLFRSTASRYLKFLVCFILLL